MSNTSEKPLFSPIGVVHSPFDPDFTPNQPLEREGAACRIELDEAWLPALRDLDRFRYVMVLTWPGRIPATGQPGEVRVMSMSIAFSSSETSSR